MLHAARDSTHEAALRVAILILWLSKYGYIFYVKEVGKRKDFVMLVHEEHAVMDGKK